MLALAAAVFALQFKSHLLYFTIIILLKPAQEKSLNLILLFKSKNRIIVHYEGTYAKDLPILSQDYKCSLFKHLL